MIFLSKLGLPYGSLYIILWNIYGETFWLGDHHVEGDSRSVLIGQDILCTAGANKKKLSNLCVMKDAQRKTKNSFGARLM